MATRAAARAPRRRTPPVNFLPSIVFVSVFLLLTGNKALFVLGAAGMTAAAVAGVFIR